MSEQLELNFGPNVTQCAHCGNMVHGLDVVIKQFYTGQIVDVEHFCSDSCHQAWYIQRLNQWGL